MRTQRQIGVRILLDLLRAAMAGGAFVLIKRHCVSLGALRSGKIRLLSGYRPRRCVANKDTLSESRNDLSQSGISNLKTSASCSSRHIFSHWAKLNKLEISNVHALFRHSTS
jgi:hypothetical protein